MSCLLPAAEVYVGKPGSGIWGPLERSVCSLPSARTGETATWGKFSFHLTIERHLDHISCFLFVPLNHMNVVSMLLLWHLLCIAYNCVALMLISQSVFSVYPGWYSERSAVCSSCGGFLHLPLASGPRWRAVWTEGVVQHRCRPFGPSTHDGWWDTGVTLCHTSGRTNGWMNKSRNQKFDIKN